MSDKDKQVAHPSAPTSNCSKYLEMSDDEYREIDKIGRVPSKFHDAGWHFCSQLDYALVNRKDVADFCGCFDGECVGSVHDDH